ncbi:hypothetical protein Hamer_G003843 [Homarus americanus]|uniref:Uncharacterized protein n=1 Tax=Homarus americanus TaxID=6706 RepID=A0A8J5TLW4_HOMAM|nr:hypothetical protein Hamer_G003843 [Homarus americanus]
MVGKRRRSTGKGLCDAQLDFVLAWCLVPMWGGGAGRPLQTASHRLCLHVLAAQVTELRWSRHLGIDCGCLGAGDTRRNTSTIQGWAATLTAWRHVSGRASQPATLTPPHNTLRSHPAKFANPS